MDAGNMSPCELEKHRLEHAIDTLEDALARCRSEDMWTTQVYEALKFLEQRARQRWPLDQFRQGLRNNGSNGWQAEGRWQTLNASLNGIKLAVGYEE